MEISIWAVVFFGIAIFAFVGAAIARDEKKTASETVAYFFGFVSLFVVCCNIIYCNFNFGLDRSTSAGNIGWVSFWVTVGLGLVIFVFTRGILSFFED